MEVWTRGGGADEAQDCGPPTSLILERVGHSKSIFDESALPPVDEEEGDRAALLGHARAPRAAHAPPSAHERALWHWVNVVDMDGFLKEIYEYYMGQGYTSIVLGRVLSVLTCAFVVVFAAFLGGCIDYSAIRMGGTLHEALVGQCFARVSTLSIASVAVVGMVCAWQAVIFGSSLKRLAALRDIYTHLFDIPEDDLVSIPWEEVVTRLQRLAEAHPCAAHHEGVSFDALSVAHRIMRQENFLIALEDHGILCAEVPLPTHSAFVHSALGALFPRLSRALEWNLRFCLLGFAFNASGQFQPHLLEAQHRAESIASVRRRFLFMALVNAVLAPFLVVYLLVYSFFRYFEEYHRNPASLGSRQYTLLARWRFREYNELPHLFQQRLHQSYASARTYLDQFPRARIVRVARFGAFISGSFVAVFLLGAVIEPDVMVHFDIVPGRNVLFFLGVCGTALAAFRGMIPDEHAVRDPQAALDAVIHYTHYCPPAWRQGQMYSTRVLREFCALYALKVHVFLNELLSVLITPLVLWRCQERLAEKYVDFFRHGTVHVPGLGYVCRYAAFDSMLSFSVAHPAWASQHQVPSAPPGRFPFTPSSSVRAM